LSTLLSVSFGQLFLDKLATTVITEEKATVGEAMHPARDIVLRLPGEKTHIRLRLCLVGTRVCVVTLIGSRHAVEGKFASCIVASFAPTN
jgi:hypothetical protein